MTTILDFKYNFSKKLTTNKKILSPVDASFIEICGSNNAGLLLWFGMPDDQKFHQKRQSLFKSERYGSN